MNVNPFSSPLFLSLFLPFLTFLFFLCFLCLCYRTTYPVSVGYLVNVHQQFITCTNNKTTKQALLIYLYMVYTYTMNSTFLCFSIFFLFYIYFFLLLRCCLPSNRYLGNNLQRNGKQCFWVEKCCSFFNN